MKTFRNNNTFRGSNNRRHRFRSNDSSFKRNDSEQKFSSNFSPNSNFQRGMSGRNNQNASRLIEKYSDLAREALSHGDRILSENYFQHADHFMRILREQEVSKVSKIHESDSKNKITEVLKTNNTTEDKPTIKS